MTHTIMIPQWHPATINKLYSGHWSKRKKLKDADRAIIEFYSKGFPAATGKRLVSISIILKKKQRAADSDAYHKSLLDGLVHAEMLVDDNRCWTELDPINFERATGILWGTRIVLTDIHGEAKKLPKRYCIGSVPDHKVKPKRKGLPPI